MVKIVEYMTSLESMIVDVAPGNVCVVKIKQPKIFILDKSNYHACRAQFIVNLKGYQLIGYLEGTVPIEDPLSIQHDQIILGWFLSAISR